MDSVVSMNVRIWGLAAVGAAVATAVVMACNGGNDPQSACNGYCQHLFSCNGLSGSTIDQACSNSCADAAGYANGACGANTNVAITNYFNCLQGLPCSDYSLLDGGLAVDAFVGCALQSGCQ